PRCWFHHAVWLGRGGGSDSRAQRRWQPPVRLRKDRVEAADEHVDRVERDAAVHPGVEVALAGPYLHLDPDEAARRQLDRRHAAPQHPPVKDPGRVGTALVLDDKVRDRVAADLLLAVERDA